jgi:prepilin-type N-terminal cleavage/methylation domain-containing protein
MDKKGITLTELVFTISIIGILALAGGFTYADWIKKYRVEKVAKELYMDLMHARVMAMEKNLRHFIVLEPGSYAVIEDTNEDGSKSTGDYILPDFPKSLRCTLHWNGAGNIIKCDTRGLMSSLRTVWISIPEEPETGSDYDCLKVSRTRISLGQYDGSTCKAK